MDCHKKIFTVYENWRLIIMLAIACQMNPVYMICLNKYELNIVIYLRFKLAVIIQIFL
jgi:hypothetical protein